MAWEVEGGEQEEGVWQGKWRKGNRNREYGMGGGGRGTGIRSMAREVEGGEQE